MTRLPDMLRTLLAALLSTLLLALGYGAAWPLALDIGGRDARFVAGFNAPEVFGTATARWTTGDAQVTLPHPPAGMAALLALRLIDSRPPEQPPASVTISSNRQPLLAFSQVRDGRGPRTYQLLAAPASGLGWGLTIGITSDTISPANDPRRLGVVLDSVRLAPLGEPVLPPPWYLAVGLAAGALAYMLARRLGLGWRPALLAVATMAALLAWGSATRPLEVLPFIQRIVALLALGCGGLWLAGWLTQAPDERAGDQKTRSAPSATRPLAMGDGQLVNADRVPIYLAVAWWLGPLFQLVLSADGAQNVTPAPATAWLAVGLVLSLAGVLLWQRVREKPQERELIAPAAGGGRWSVGGGSWSPVLVVFAVFALAHLAYTLWFAFTRSGPDFWILFKGAREWARGGALYDLAAITTNHFGHVFKVPPFYAMLFLPFVFRDGFEILLYHRLLNLLLLTATVFAWYRMWRLPLGSALGLGTLLLLSFRPFADTLAYGQIDLALLLILTLALWALRRGRAGAAGALVALGALFKIYPVLLLAFFVVKRQWRALGGFVIGMLIYNSIAIVVMGWEAHATYLGSVLPQIGGTTAWVENQTISAFLARLVAPPGEAVILADRGVATLGLLISGALGLLGCLLALPGSERTSTQYALQYGQFLLLMVLVVPAAWMHYETLLFVPYAALLLHWQGRSVGLGRVAALALSFALTAYGNQWSYFDGTVMGVLTLAGVSYKFYGMLLLGGLLVAELAPALRWQRAPALQPQPAQRLQP